MPFKVQTKVFCLLLYFLKMNLVKMRILTFTLIKMQTQYNLLFEQFITAFLNL